MSRISRERIQGLAVDITAALMKEPGTKLVQSENAVRMLIVRALTNEVNLDDQLTAQAKKKIASMQSPPPEASPQYATLLQNLYDKELATLRKIR